MTQDMQENDHKNSHTITIDLPDLAATQALGTGLAGWLTAGDMVLLEGDLGAGKSALSRACIQAMPNADNTSQFEEVPSPTFTLLQTYERLAGMVYHFDLYRLGDPEELYELGWEEASIDGICLIEWPERLGYLKPKSYLEIQLHHKGEGRTVEFKPTGVSNERITQLKQLANG